MVLFGSWCFGLLDQETEWCEGSERNEVELHEFELAQGELFEKGTGFVDSGNIQEKDYAVLIAADEPLIDLAGQVQPDGIAHFLLHNGHNLFSSCAGGDASNGEHAGCGAS